MWNGGPFEGFSFVQGGMETHRGRVMCATALSRVNNEETLESAPRGAAVV